jgi:hypothetical protein
VGTDRDIVSITLTCSSPTIQTGAPSGVTIEVRNVTDHPVWIIGIVDGSELGARFPRWIPIVEGAVDVQAPELSDFTSPLRPADFRKLEAGEAFDPSSTAGGAHFFPLATFEAISETPGRYTLAVELDTRGPDESAWAGTLPDRRPEAKGEAEEVRHLLLKVPRLCIRSNTLEVVVR